MAGAVVTVPPGATVVVLVAIKAQVLQVWAHCFDIASFNWGSVHLAALLAQKFMS